MIRMTHVSTMLAIALTVSQAFAIHPSARHPSARRASAAPRRAAPSKIATQVPGSTNSAVFVNVKRLFALYGDLIAQTPQYSQLEKFIAAGFPNPKTDVDEIGMVSDIEHFNESDLSGVITGRVDMAKLMAFAQAHGVTMTPSMYQGVTLMSVKDGNQTGQVGFVNEEVTLVSLSQQGEAGTHAGTKAIVATIKGEAPSFAQSHSVRLPANYLANLSLKVPASLAETLAGAAERFPGVEQLKFLSGSITADDRTKDATAHIVGTFATPEAAQGVEQMLKALAGNFRDAGRAASLLNKVTITAAGTKLTITITLPRADMEGLVRDM